MKGFWASVLVACGVTCSHAKNPQIKQSSNYAASRVEGMSCTVSTVSEFVLATQNTDCANIGMKSGRYVLTDHVKPGSSLALKRSVSIMALDGEGSVVIDAAGKSGVLGVYNRSASVHLKGINITGGSLPHNNAAGFFVGMGSKARLEDCHIYGNSAGEFGGGIAVWVNSSLIMIRSSVHDNVAGQVGGGVYCAGDVQLTETSIMHNKAAKDKDFSVVPGQCRIANYSIPITILV